MPYINIPMNQKMLNKRFTSRGKALHGYNGGCSGVARNCTGGGVRQDGWVREGRSPLPVQLGGMGERCKLPHRGLGLRPISFALYHYEVMKSFDFVTPVVLFKKLLLLICMPAEVTYRGNLLLYLFCV